MRPETQAEQAEQADKPNPPAGRRGDTALMNCYQPQPVAFERGEGAWLLDAQGDRYLDSTSGIAVCSLGHAHPRLARVLADQAGRLLHTSNLFRIPLQERLARQLTELSGMERVFFCNSGTEANETALKLTRLYAARHGIAEPLVVVAEGGFHGRTLGALSASGNDALQRGFAPLLPGFVRVPYADAAALVEPLAQSRTVALLLEPIQGEAGVILPPPGYLRRARQLCDQHHCLLLLDEIQTGLCRTGTWFSCEREQVLPDVLTLAKSLGNGVPIGACLARGEAAELFEQGSHGSTFGGNPLAMRIALEVLDMLQEGQLARRAAALGERLRSHLARDLGQEEMVREIRGCGLMIGIELKRDCRILTERALQRRLLLNVTVGNVIRLLPPLIMEEREIDLLGSMVSALVRELAAG